LIILYSNSINMPNILKFPITMIRPLYERTNFHKSVITEIKDEKLMHAYNHCRSITRLHAKTFYMATRFLPNKKQRSIFAIYGLCRYLDDLVDESEDLMIRQKITREDILVKLDQFREKLINTYNGNEQNDPIMLAFSDTLNSFNISMKFPMLLMEGVKMDLIKDRYATFDELYEYSYKVASVVGLMTSEVFGYENPKAIEHAVDLGIAMQLTNILRDVGEDLTKNRIYLPKDELDRFRVTEDDLFNHTMSENFIEFMKFQIDRTKKYYESADRGIGMLNRDSRLPVGLARENYSRILNKIEENGYNVFRQRAFLNSTEKLSMVPKVMFSLRSS
jgi:phytoene synthase